MKAKVCREAQLLWGDLGFQLSKQILKLRWQRFSNKSRKLELQLLPDALEGRL